MGTQRDKSGRSNLETCPKCGFEGISGPECPRCGLVLAKYMTPEHRAEISARHATAAPPAKPRRAGLVIGVLGLLIFVGAMIAVGTILLDRDPGFLSTWLQGAAGHEVARSLQARATQSMVVYFDSDGCPRCRAFATDALGAAEVQKRLEAAVKVHVRVRPGTPEEPLSVRYRVTTFPALFVVAGQDQHEVPIENKGAGEGELRTPAELLAAIDQALQLQAAPLAVAAGLRALEAQQAQQALAEFERALQLVPDSIDALRGRGLARLALDDKENALADFVAWAKRDGENPQAFALSATTALDLGRSDDALASLNRLIDLQPDYEQGRAYQLRASLYVKRGDFTAAMADAERACALGNEEGCQVAKQNQAALDRAAPKGKKRRGR